MRQVVFITGVSSGIGRAAAIAFVRAGYHVAGTARRAERLDALQHEIQSLSAAQGDFLAITGDVSSAESMQAAVATTVATFGRLDILVANAGVGQRGAVADAEWDDIQTLLRTNIDGVLHTIRACVPEMRKVGSGHIITISSVVFNLISPYAAIYAASKAFVSSLANSIRLELADDNICVSDILVGRTLTEFNQVRLGEGQRRPSRLPAMSAEQVAEALVDVAQRPRKTVTLRLFDKLVVWGNRLIPGIMGKLAERQYK